MERTAPSVTLSRKPGGVLRAVAVQRELLDRAHVTKRRPCPPQSRFYLLIDTENVSNRQEPTGEQAADTQADRCTHTRRLRPIYTWTGWH